jgi:phosphate transport system protein
VAGNTAGQLLTTKGMTEAMRESFHKELDELDQDIVRMGALVEQSTQQVTTALIECDHELARKVYDSDNAIDELFLDIEKRSLVLLAQQAPVAADLRLIVAILRVLIDLERSGDLCHNIAKLALAEDFCQPDLKQVRALLADLGFEAAKLIGAAVDAWASKDEKMASDIALQDDVLDDLHARLIQSVLQLKGEDTLGSAVRVAMIGRYLERIGDHAVNMGERIRYFLTGDAEHLG